MVDYHTDRGQATIKSTCKVIVAADTENNLNQDKIVSFATDGGAWRNV